MSTAPHEQLTVAAAALAEKENKFKSRDILINDFIFQLLCIELLSKVVFKHLSQAATWFDSVTSIPSLNFTPLMTLPR